jgi:hypothetical protein
MNSDEERTRGTEKGTAWSGGNKPDKTIRHPTYPQHPPDGRVASKALPPQHHLGAEGPSGHQRREEDQPCPAHVVDGLQEEDLREDLQRRQLCQGAGPRWPAAARHGAERPRWLSFFDDRKGEGQMRRKRALAIAVPFAGLLSL